MNSPLKHIGLKIKLVTLEKSVRALRQNGKQSSCDLHSRRLPNWRLPNWYLCCFF